MVAFSMAKLLDCGGKRSAVVTAFCRRSPRWFSDLRLYLYDSVLPTACNRPNYGREIRHEEGEAMKFMWSAGLLTRLDGAYFLTRARSETGVPISQRHPDKSWGAHPHIAPEKKEALSERGSVTRTARCLQNQGWKQLLRHLASGALRHTEPRSGIVRGCARLGCDVT